MQAVFPVVDERRLPKSLEMLRCVGERQADLAREGLNGTLSLGQKFQDLEAVRARERLPDAGELPVQPILELAVATRLGSQIK
jgi:hypothetical protein